jgi:hypothetical protein
MEAAIQVQQPTGPIAPEGQNTTDRPAWLPENFKSPEDMAKSYQSLQAEYTKLRQGVAPADPAAPVAPAEPAPAPTSNDDLVIKDKVEATGLDFDSMTNEFMAEGKLSEKSYEALTAKGFPREIVDDYIKMKQVEATSIRNDIVQSAGGEEGYKSMVEWAAANYADASTFNQMITSGDPATMRMAVTALRAAYTSSNGMAPNLVSGNNGPSAGDIYADDRELMSDMAKPEYRTDITFRRAVEAKLSRSTALLR